MSFVTICILLPVLTKEWTVFLILKYFIKQYFTETNNIVRHYLSQGAGIAQLVESIGYRLGNCGIMVRFPSRDEIILFPMVRQLGCEADHTPPSSTKAMYV